MVDLRNPHAANPLRSLSTRQDLCQTKMFERQTRDLMCTIPDETNDHPLCKPPSGQPYLTDRNQIKRLNKSV